MVRRPSAEEHMNIVVATDGSNVAIADAGSDPWFIARLQTGSVARLGPTQYFKGSVLFVP